MPVRIDAEFIGLEKSAELAAKRAGRNLKLNLGTSAKSIEGLSQPLGRITGKADQFTKSMEAANARVLAFGASVGVLNTVTQAFKDLVTTTIEVEKQMTAIGAILGKTTTQLDGFSKSIFNVARNTEQSFSTVATAALELSRQGLKGEEVVSRLNDALILARLSGQDAANAVGGLTAAINGFIDRGITSTQVVNKFSEAAKSAAVSERDLAEAFKRAGAVANQAGVTFDELTGIVSAVQQKTARGGAVIGNSFKTIFTRLQSIDKLETMQNLGVQVTDASGAILSGTKLIQNLAKTISDLPEAKQLQIAEDLVGKFQVAPFVSILKDFNSEQSIAIKLTEISQNASTAAFERNEALNKTLSAAINRTTVSLQELANELGKIGVTDSLRTIVDFFSGLSQKITDVLQGDSVGSKFAKGIVKGIGNVITGPGLAIFGAIILKLTADLAKFGIGSLKTFFGINKAAQEQKLLQGQIASSLLTNQGIQDAILKIERSQISAEEKKAQQTKFFTTALNEQLAVMQKMQTIAMRVAPGVMAGTRGGRGRGAFGRGAGGFIPNYNAVMGYAPNFAAESADIAKGVGGAPRSARPVAIPNFNFGAGQRGTMVANTSEFMVPNFAGTGGTAIFNQNMVSSMGMPAGAKSIGAAGGFIPNFVDTDPVSTKGQTKGMTLTRALSAFEAGRIKRSALTAGFGKTAIDKALGPAAAKSGSATTPKSTLTLDANSLGGIGLVALFSDAKKRSGFKDLQEGSGNPRKNALFNAGVRQVLVNNIAVSDLQTMRKAQKEKFAAQNRNKIAKLFSQPLGQYGNFILGRTFKNDERTAVSNRIKEIISGGGSTALFSSAVEGGIFESAIGLVTKGTKRIKDFDGLKDERAPFDFEEGGPADAFFRKIFFGDPDKKIIKADAKRTASADALNSVVGKVINDAVTGPMVRNAAIAQGFDLGSKSKSIFAAPKAKGRSSAGGFIPNFAVSPLDQAVQREASAGLPINQIRINQDGRLRNSGNPMGLAVTNTRDEPTGAIPNFRKGPSVDGGGGDFLTKLLLAQTAFMMLTPVIGEVTGEQDKLATVTNIASAAMMGLTVATLLGSKGLGKMANFFSNTINPFAGVGKRGMAKGAAIMKGTPAQVVPASSLTGPGFTRAGTAARPIAGGARLAGSALLRFAGPVGIAATAATVFVMTVNAASGANKSLKIAQDALSESTKTAAKELGELQIPEEFKQERRESAKRLAENSANELRFSGVDIKGFKDNKQIDALRALAEQAFTGGARQADVEQVFTNLAKGGDGKGGDLDSDDIRAAIKKLTELTEIDGDKIQRKIFSNLSTKERADIARVRRADDRIAKSGGELTKEESAFKRQTRLNLEARFAREGVDERLARGTIAGSLGAEVIEQENEGLRIQNQIFKENLRSLVAKQKLNTDILDQADMALKKAELENRLDKASLQPLREAKAEAEAQLKIRNKILDTSVEIVAMGKDLTVATEEEARLKQLIVDANKDGEISDRERLDILNKATEITETQSSEFANQIKAKINLLDEEKLSIEKSKEKLIAEQRVTEEFRQQQVEIDRRNQRILGLTQGQLQTDLLRISGKRDDIQLGSDLATARARPTILAGRADQRQAAEARLAILGLNQEEQTAKFRANQEIQAQRELGKVERFIGKKFDGKTSAELIGGLEGEALRDQIGSVIAKLGTKGDKGAFRDGLQRFVEGLEDSENQFFQNQKAAEKSAEALLDFAGVVKIATVSELFQDRQVQKAEGANQQQFDLLTTTDPIERIKKQIRFDLLNQELSAQNPLELRAALLNQERQVRQFDVSRTADPAARLKAQNRLNNFDARQQATTPEDFLRLDRAEQFGDKIIDASATFAKNIGDAMVDAIAKGQSLGDALMSAASGFFNMISQAFLQEAVNDVVGSSFFKSFTGGISFLNPKTRNAGGMITGGSGVKDDVPALLTGGEFIMRRSAVQKFGPRFMEAINSGNIPMFNTGGMFTPGTFGQGSIRGKSNLLNFATQSFTGGSFDSIGGSGGLGFASLEPQSGRLTMFGRRNNPMFQREQESKRQAFGLFARQVQAEKQAKERNKQASRGLLGSIVGAVASIALSGITNKIFNRGASSVLTGADTLATGGYVSPRAGIDNVPAMLSGGEFVMNAAATQRIGAGNLAAANAGAGAGGGEDKEAVINRLDQLIAVSGDRGETVVNITINSDGSETQDSNAEEKQQNFAKRIKDVVKQTISDEQRLGGTLRRR